MEALRASYADSSSSDSDSDSDPASENTKPIPKQAESPLPALPPPPISLLNPPNSFGAFDYLQSGCQPSRVRTFPHVEGNYALHVYIPVRIPSEAKKGLTQLLRKVAHVVPGLHVADGDVSLDVLLKDDQKLLQVALGREFHISLGRAVPLRVHQIDSVVAMLRQKLQFQKRYWIDFSKWEVFVNDDQTCTFLSLEILKGGLFEITRQIQAVNEVYKLHNLPEFYKDPRPHISIAWASGDISDLLKRVLEEEMTKYTDGGSLIRMLTCKFSSIQCKIGNKIYNICRFHEEQ